MSIGCVGPAPLAKNELAVRQQPDKIVVNACMKAEGGRPLHDSQIEGFVGRIRAALQGIGHPPLADEPRVDAFDPAVWGGDVFEPHFASGAQAPAVARSVVEDAAKPPLSRAGRAMSVLTKGGDVLYSGGRFVAGKGAGAVSSVVRWGWREITHNPIGMLMLMLAASKGYLGDGWMPNKFEQAVNKALRSDTGVNPVHLLASEGLGAAFNQRQGARVLREARHFLRPESRTVPRKLWHGMQFIVGKAAPVVERIASDPVDTGGKMLVGGFLLGRNSKVGKLVVSGAGTLLTAAKILYSPLDHMNPWSRRMPRNRW